MRRWISLSNVIASLNVETVFVKMRLLSDESQYLLENGTVAKGSMSWALYGCRWQI